MIYSSLKKFPLQKLRNAMYCVLSKPYKLCLKILLLMIKYHMKFDDDDIIINNSGTDYAKGPSNTHVLSFSSLLLLDEC